MVSAYVSKKVRETEREIFVCIMCMHACMRVCVRVCVCGECLYICEKRQRCLPKQFKTVTHVQRAPQSANSMTQLTTD